MKSREERYSDFITELETICVQHGVTLQVTGGVEIHDEKIEELIYSDDPTSGDIDVVSLRLEGDE